MQLGFSSLKKRKVSQNDLGRARVSKKLATDPEILRDRNKFHSFLEDFADYYLDPIYKWAGSMHETIKDAFGSGEYVSSSAGSADAGKPVILDANGRISTSMLGNSIGYSIPVCAAQFSPADSTNYIIGGNFPAAPTSAAPFWWVHVLYTGTITTAYIRWIADGAAGSAEDIRMSIRLNNAADYEIATIGSTVAAKLFSTNELSIAVREGDYIGLKIECPAWATNPTNVWVYGNIYVSP